MKYHPCRCAFALAAALSLAAPANATDYRPALELRFNEPGLPRVWSGHGFAPSYGGYPAPLYYYYSAPSYGGNGWGGGRGWSGHHRGGWGGHHHGRGGWRR